MGFGVGPFLAIFIYLFCHASFASKNTSACIDGLKPTLQIANLVSTLDCLASAKAPSLLGMQWLVAKKSHWAFAKKGLSTPEMFVFEPADNRLDPAAKNYVFLNSKHVINSKKFLKMLETSILPTLLTGAFSGPSRLSFEAMLYQHVSLAVNEGLPITPTKIEAMKVTAPVLKLSPTNFIFGAELESLFWSSTEFFTASACLATSEQLVKMGLFLGLEHPRLVRSVFAKLPSVIGDPNSALTGGLSHDYVRPLRGRSNEEFRTFGPRAFVGRTIYTRAMHKKQLDDRSYQGQNSLIVKMSKAAFEDFLSLPGGFGTVHNLPDNPDPLKGISSEIAKLKAARGFSYLMASYWQLRTQGKHKLAVKILDRPFFQETITETGDSLADWLEFLYDSNPRTPYKIFAYDYRLRLKFYDLVMSSLTQKDFPPIKVFLR